MYTQMRPCPVIKHHSLYSATNTRAHNCGLSIKNAQRQAGGHAILPCTLKAGAVEANPRYTRLLTQDRRRVSCLLSEVRTASHLGSSLNVLLITRQPHNSNKIHIDSGSPDTGQRLPVGKEPELMIHCILSHSARKYDNVLTENADLYCGQQMWV